MSILAEFDLGQSILIGLILFLSTLVVRVSGFGGALTAMPLIIPIIGLPPAAPLMNLFGVTTFSTVVWQRWRDLRFQDVWRLVLMNVLFAPVGIWILSQVNESLLRLFFGGLCVIYASMRMFKVPAPTLRRPGWQWLYGAISGIFTGTFSLGGVAAVLYADTQPWEPERFRLNLFSFFFVTSYINIITRYLSGQITPQVIILWITSTPFLFIGLWVGEKIANRVDQARFSKLVLLLLIVLGGRLIYSGL